MRSAGKSYLGMIAVAAILVVAVVAASLRIQADTNGRLPASISATPAITGNAPDLLVDARWFRQYGNSVEYIYDVSDKDVYDAGHIPGAHHIWWQDAMAQHANNYGEADVLNDPMPEGDVWGRLNIGAPQRARILLYDSNNSERATWLAWVLRGARYTDVLVLDGGLPAWIGEGGEVTTDVPEALTSATNLEPVWLDTWEMRREPLLEQLDNPNLRIIDARNAEQKADTVNGTVREGRIPGAISIPNTMVQRDDGTFKSPDELRDIFADHGITSENLVVVYGQFNKDSGVLWMALRLAGFKEPKVYQEGYVAWGYNQDLPLETGAEPTRTPAPVATPLASPVATPMASPIASPMASPEDEGPVDLTGD